MNRLLKLSTLLIVFFLAAGCGPESQIKRAQKLEKKGKHYEAWLRYQEIAANNSKSDSAPEALFRAGWIAQRHLNDCNMAGVFYEKVTAAYPQSDWARYAANQSRNCPDYFPLMTGYKWVEGDSDSKGKNARIESVCKPAPGKDVLPSEGGMIERTYFAGASKFRTTQAVYKKVEGDVQEFAEDSQLRPKIVFKVPPELGARWKTIAANRAFFYEVVAIDKTVKVEAGEFKSCVVVRSYLEGASGSTNEYYAPSVGKILTTLSTPAGEKRNTELLSYEPAQDVEFVSTEKNK